MKFFHILCVFVLGSFSFSHAGDHVIGEIKITPTVLKVKDAKPDKDHNASHGTPVDIEIEGTLDLYRNDVNRVEVKVSEPYRVFLKRKGWHGHYASLFRKGSNLYARVLAMPEAREDFVGTVSSDGVVTLLERSRLKVSITQHSGELGLPGRDEILISIQE